MYGNEVCKPKTLFTTMTLKITTKYVFNLLIICHIINDFNSISLTIG